jgi:hypothetical protein
MTLGLAYWILMLIWFVFGVAEHMGYVGGAYAFGSIILLFVLFVLRGWQTCGPPLHK